MTSLWNNDLIMKQWLDYEIMWNNDLIMQQWLDYETCLCCVVEKTPEYCIVNCIIYCAASQKINMKTRCVEWSTCYVLGLLGWVIKKLVMSWIFLWLGNVRLTFLFGLTFCQAFQMSYNCFCITLVVLILPIQAIT